MGVDIPSTVTEIAEDAFDADAGITLIVHGNSWAADWGSSRGFTVVTAD